MNLPNLQQLIICRSMLNDSTIQKLIAVLDTPNDTALQCALTSDLIEKAETLRLSGNLIGSYITYIMAQGDNMAALITERSNGQIGESLYLAFSSDIALLYPFFHLSSSKILTYPFLSNYQPTKPSNLTAFDALQLSVNQSASVTALTDTFIRYYRTYGYGDIANFRAFRWDTEKQLVGIRHFDQMKLEDLIGYHRQKEMLVGNTEAFVAGKPANNVLLVGARGTGKSSGVKALANQYFDRGLRLLEMTKHQLIQLPKIMETLRLIGSKKFIIFLDDLSFEDVESEYKYLKSAIEGGVEAKPPNVLIYATSNRRHLIKETWKNRGESNDELHYNDSVNETISLSDRFGLTINYLAPSQSEYLEIIAELLKKSGITLDSEDLRIQALRWEITHSGRSGRTAQQFVNHYLGSKA